jgi:hypothetical protein
MTTFLYYHVIILQDIENGRSWSSKFKMERVYLQVHTAL